ncbi:MAG: arylamine N-acetyltransferase [Actinomycetota bacterium]|nr:arylamine N-acetyltransferase [Actinomycetota bacterium]
MHPSDRDRYLARLGTPPDLRHPSVEGLAALHAAHVERIPYEVVDIQLGRPTTIEPADSAHRITRRHRGGYCYHLNGAFSALLRSLGYDVRWHRAGAQYHGEAPPGAVGNHLALTVRGLPSDVCPDGVWVIDAGLGDGLHHPIPLREGTYRQGPLRFTLRPSEVEPGGWRLDHDERGSFAGMDVRADEAGIGDFLDQHHHLSTSPTSGFVRTCAVQRRDGDGADMLAGCVLRRLTAAGTSSHTIETSTDWFAALADVFDLPLTDLEPTDRDRLWRRVRDAHEAWQASRTSA